MRNVLDRNSRENQNTHYMLRNFFPENCAAYVVMLKNVVEPDRPQMTIQYGASTVHAG
jgi:hypothetical protein